MRFFRLVPLAVLPLLLAAPASAATFGPATSVPCVERVSAVSTGTVFAAGSCAGRVQVSRREPGGAFRPVGSWAGDARVVDVAADGAATFVLLARAAAGQGEDLLIGKLPHGGRPSALTTLGSSEASVEASVTASGGRWAAAWVETVRELDQPGSGSSTLKTRGTLLAAGTQVFNEPRAVSPSVAYGPDKDCGTGAYVAGRPVPSCAVLVFTASLDEPLRITHALPGKRFGSTGGIASNGGAAAALPTVVLSGGTEVFAWSREQRPVLQLGRDGTRRDLPSRGSVTGLGLDASSGSAFVVTSELFTSGGSQTQRVYARDVTAAAVRSVTELPLGPHAADAIVRLSGVTAARGRATVVTTGGVSDAR